MSRPGRRRARAGGLAGLAVASWLACGGLVGAGAASGGAIGAGAASAGAASGGAASGGAASGGAIDGGRGGAESGAARPGDHRSWTVYHHDPAGSGVAHPIGAIRTSARAWTSPELDGDIYGEPLVFAGRVYVATENNTVYALSARTGKVGWSAHLGPPVPAEALPCGNISPTVGITGTPVIDAARREIFVVADVLTRGRPAHLLVGLGTGSGKRMMTRAVDPPGANTAALLQRTGLTIAAGRVVFGFGGNFGDCSTYRGRVVAVSEAGGPPAFFTVDTAPDESRGAIWMGGAAPTVDLHGNLWVTAGNGSVTSSAHAYDHSDSVLKLSPSLRLLGFFAPSSWPEDNATDLDMSTGVALLPGGQVVAAGKSRIAYLLSAARPGGIGGQQAQLASVCGGEVVGGTAVLGRTVYLPCLSGIAAVRATPDPPSLRLLWDSRTGGGPPIVAGGLVWTISLDGTLYGLDPASGKVLRRASVGQPANHFPTPSAAGGLLLSAAARQVVAFAAAPAGQPAASASATATGAAGAAPGDAAGGQDGLSAAAVAGLVAGSLAVLGALGWLLWRLRVRGSG